MPILSFTVRSQDLDNPSDHTTQVATKTIKLPKTYKMKYLKLLHCYHNINFTNIHNEDDVSQQSNTILFASFGFLNGQNAVLFENDNNEVYEHSGLVCIGETVDKPNTCSFRDTYKVLHSKELLYLREPFKITLFQLRCRDPTDTNSDIDVYNATGSHKIVPITVDQFRGPLTSGGQFISFVFEYEDDQSK
tara:strand:- start:1609 stop:2181 length:573 start_codon:yes stop_codon:yes gene_type:complete